MLFRVLLLVSTISGYAQGSDPATKKIDTLNLDFAALATKITNGEKSNYRKAELLLRWVSGQLNWMATDYNKRTVKEIIARGGGNCFELAKVYMQLVNAAQIEYRPIAEIHLHQYSDSRQVTAAAKVKEQGNRLSVFGKQHNDHRWVEVYDDQNKKWEPVDPSMNVIGVEQWLKARVWFGERITLDSSFSNQMIVPFAIFVTGKKQFAIAEARSTYYLVEQFDQLYDNQLRKLPSWNAWVKAVTNLAGPAKAAFEGTENLHDQGHHIQQLNLVYLQLKKEYGELK